MQLEKHQPELLDMSLQEKQPTTDAQSFADLQGQKLAHSREKNALVTNGTLAVTSFPSPGEWPFQLCQKIASELYHIPDN